MLRCRRPLPLALLSLIFYVSDTQQQQLSLDAISTFSSASTLTLPSHAGDIAISIALCGTPGDTTPIAIFTNISTGTPTQGNVGTQDVFEIFIKEGLGTWTGPIGQGGRLAITNTGQAQYEVGVSTDAEQVLHQYFGQDGLLFGDSTGNQAIFFSPPFESVATTQPKFPNYTLPTVQTPFSVSQPSSTPQFALTLVETSSASGLLGRSSCALRATSSKGTVKNQTSWIRNEVEGWRFKWLVEGLSPGTNYSAFVSRDGTKVSGPLYFTTKSGRYASLLRFPVLSRFSLRKKTMKHSFIQLPLG
jgi:calcium channel MID1